MMSQKPFQLFVFAAVLGCTACSTAHWVRPSGKGSHTLSASVGGPVAGIGSPSLPVPLATLNYKYGASEKMDVFIGWHVLETFLNEGNIYFDLGLSYQLMKQKRGIPALSVALILSPLFNAQDSWFMADLPIAASWAVGKEERHLLYLGFHNSFTPTSNELLATAPYTFSPFVGYRADLLKNKGLQLGAELKWLRPYQNTEFSTVAFVAPGNQGALSFLVHVGYRFGGGA